MSEWRYYLPGTGGEADDALKIRRKDHTFHHGSIAAEIAFSDYWVHHDGYELGVDQDYELVLLAPDGSESRWSVRAEESITFDADRFQKGEQE